MNDVGGRVFRAERAHLFSEQTSLPKRSLCRALGLVVWAFLAHASGTGALLGGVREDVGYATLFDELGVVRRMARECRC